MKNKFGVRCLAAAMAVSALTVGAPGLVVNAAPAADKVKAESTAQSIALHAEAISAGFEDMVDYQDAQNQKKSAGEFYNNVIMETPKIDMTTPVGQGGNLVVNGKVTNITASVFKVDVAFVDSARRAVTDGVLLNVANVRFPVKEATVNFYMPGVAADANVTAIQYVNGSWVNVDVVEVRADHVVLDLEQNGVVAFFQK